MQKLFSPLTTPYYAPPHRLPAPPTSPPPPNTPPRNTLEQLKQELLNNKKKTDLDYKKLAAVTVQLENMNKEEEQND